MVDEKQEIITIDNEHKLKNNTNELVNKIIETTNTDEVKDLTKLFSINQAKKNMVRVVKLNDLLDKINDQAIDRFENNPDEISNQELLNYMKVVQDNIEKSQKMIDSVDTNPVIQINQQNNEITISPDNIKDISKDSQENILAFINSVIQASRDNNVEVELEGEVVDNDK